MTWKKIPDLLYDVLDPSKTIFADFSQCNAKKFGHNAGKQCVAMSLTAVIQTGVKNITTRDLSFLNTILSVENYLYTGSGQKSSPRQK